MSQWLSRCALQGSWPCNACEPTCISKAVSYPGVRADMAHLGVCLCAHLQVVLVPVSLDGQDMGSAAQLPPFTTGEPLMPPRLSDGLGINPVVGPDRFSVFNISQDKPGFAYLLVTKSANQVNSQVCLMQLASSSSTMQLLCCWQ
jgi:hypothetical protein